MLRRSHVPLRWIRFRLQPRLHLLLLELQRFVDSRYDSVQTLCAAFSQDGSLQLGRWLYEVVDANDKVDSTISDLHKAVMTLKELNLSLERTLRECRSQALVLAHINDELLLSIDHNLNDCKETLSEMDALVENLKKPTSSRNIFRKPNLLVRLTLHRQEILDFQDKISRSNCAMQTSLGVINL